MARRRKEGSKAINLLDGFSQKRPRGRPGVRASEVAGRSYQYHSIFNSIWDSVGEKLSQAKSVEDVLKAFEFSSSFQQEFKGIAPLIQRVFGDPDFPKTREARINFVADSLAARGHVSPRRSRDICGRERAKEKRLRKHRIIRHEYYIECSCGYKGPARDNACRKCGAQIPISLAGTWLAP
jgi:hypothetical protein